MKQRFIPIILIPIILVMMMGVALNIKIVPHIYAREINCHHEINLTECPFCNPELIVSKGFCKGHRVPESFCTRCNPDIIPAFKKKNDWCKGHNLPESQCIKCNPDTAYGAHKEKTVSNSGNCFHRIKKSSCPFCNPELIVSLGFCKGHSVPEAFCSRCNSNLIPAFKKQGDWCAKHKLPQSQCLSCEQESGMSVITIKDLPKNSPTLLEPNENYIRSKSEPLGECTKHNKQVKIKNSEILKHLGIKTFTATKASFKKVHRFYGTLKYDPTTIAKVSTKINGTILEVFKKPGEEVKPGDAIARISSPETAGLLAELGRLQQEMIFNNQILSREKKLTQNKLGTRLALLNAKNHARRAQINQKIHLQKIRRLEIAEIHITNAIKGKQFSNSFMIFSKHNGIVSAWEHLPGESVSVGDSLINLIDYSIFRGEIRVPQSKIHLLNKNLPVIFHPESLKGYNYSGTILYPGSSNDSRSPYIPVYARIKNIDNKLHQGMRGIFEINNDSSQERVWIPKDALQWEGCCNIVFIARNPLTYYPRKVHSGWLEGDRYVLLAGLNPGEKVVTTGSFLLKTEILKGNLGAGCCEPVEKLNQ
ncbi:efflux RND transporter periplasmic adaptor subunit [Candidatus Riflebacteria bacterium]